MTLKFYTSVTKELRVEKVRGLVPTFVEVKWEKQVGGFFASPILKRVKVNEPRSQEITNFSFKML